ncbi:MAG: sulfotransferase family 2 domain-containing protein [Chloroflexi bacterium]|nr:sulfotransferase family 2 domain-containing protein [Chloroflexota bacterium]
MSGNLQPLLAFLHIPKAGGTTMHRIIEKNYSQDAIFTIEGMRVQESIGEFLALSRAEINQLHVVKGHFRFGLHEFIQRPVTYFSLLRHPVSRVISSYFFILRTPHHTYHRLLVSQNMGLAEFVQSRVSKVATDNGQTRMLACWDCLDEVEFGECTRDMLKQAKTNLATHFGCVGIVEQFDKTLILARHAFSWNRLLYLRQNVMPSAPRPKVEDSTRQLILAANQLDLELYGYAFRLFRKAFSELGAQAEFEVKTFRLMNSIYSALVPKYASLRSLMHL